MKKNPLNFIFGYFALSDWILLGIVIIMSIDFKYPLIYNALGFSLSETIKTFIIIFSIVGIMLKRA